MWSGLGEVHYFLKVLDMGSEFGDIGCKLFLCAEILRGYLREISTFSDWLHLSYLDVEC